LVFVTNKGFSSATSAPLRCNRHARMIYRRAAENMEKHELQIVDPTANAIFENTHVEIDEKSNL